MMMPITLQVDVELLFRILLSFFLGGLIGLERELQLALVSILSGGSPLVRNEKVPGRVA